MMHSTTELTQRQVTVRMVHLDMTSVELVRVATVNDDELLYDMRELVVEKFLQLKQHKQCLIQPRSKIINYKRTFMDL